MIILLDSQPGNNFEANCSSLVGLPAAPLICPHKEH